MDKKIKLLVVEDDNDINKLLYNLFIDSGYSVQSAYSGTEAIIYLKSDEYHMVILDLMLPGKSGEELLEYIRGNSNMPILILSAKEEYGIKSNMLRAGADDFMGKPFDLDELLARVEANLRRYLGSYREEKQNNLLKYEEINLDKEKREVIINENSINLTAREFDILELFITYPNKVFSKSNLFKSIWGEEYFCDDNTITVHISNLRNKLLKGGTKKDYIKTVWGIGYKLESN